MRVPKVNKLRILILDDAAADTELINQRPNATLGRESRILDLKREVNELLVKAGHQPHYSSAVGRDKMEK